MNFSSQVSSWLGALKQGQSCLTVTWVTQLATASSLISWNLIKVVPPSDVRAVEVYFQEGHGLNNQKWVEHWLSLLCALHSAEQCENGDRFLPPEHTVSLGSRNETKQCGVIGSVVLNT